MSSMNKKQKWLVLVSVIIFIFVTLNPSVFQLKPAHILGDSYYRFGQSGPYDMPQHPKRHHPYFTERPMYQYWAVIAVPTIAFFYFFKDKKTRV